MRTTDGVCLGFKRQRPSRRESLRAGALTLAGLGLPGLFRARAEGAGVEGPAPTGFGRARSCILIFQWGGPSQLDTWDPKPDAPEAIRGSFHPIATRTPGLFISEHFPRLAQRTDQLAVIRSMSHTDPAHLSTAHRVLTGHLAPTPNSDAAGPSPRDSPHLGAIVAKVRPTRGVLPSSVTMPWTVAHPAAPGGRAPGQNAGWLGRTFDPFRVAGDPNAPDFHVAGLGLPEGVSPERLLDRRSPLDQATSAASSATSWEKFQARAFDTLAAAEARGAFQIEREDPRLRDEYGRHIHGQCLLLARRLVEAGVGLVTVNWHDDGQNFWEVNSPLSLIPSSSSTSAITFWKHKDLGYRIVYKCISARTTSSQGFWYSFWYSSAGANRMAWYSRSRAA